MRHPWTRWCMVLGLATLAACARDQPSKPQRLYSITGHVRLTGFLVDPDGAYAGTRMVGDADGWYGRDTMGRPVAGSPFWVTFVAGNDVRAQLVFR